MFAGADISARAMGGRDARRRAREGARARDTVANAARRDQAAATGYLADARKTMISSYKYGVWLLIRCIICFHHMFL